MVLASLPRSRAQLARAPHVVLLRADALEEEAWKYLSRMSKVKRSGSEGVEVDRLWMELQIEVEVARPL